MANCRQPVRTYQRKTVKKPLISISSALPVILTQEHRIRNDCFSNNENSSDSMIHDPFETTFDRIAKGAVVPPLLLDTNQSDSWNSSSENNINNATNLVKSPKDISYSSSICNDIFNLTHKDVKNTRRYKKSQKYIVGIISEPVHKKRKAISRKKDNIHLGTKIQAQKVQTNNIQRQKMVQYKLKKSSRKCSEDIRCSNNTNDWKDAVHKDISYDYNNKCLPQGILNIHEHTTTISQTISNRPYDSITTSKYTLNYYQNIKPCFIKLDTYAVQNWYTLNCEKIMGNKQNMKHSQKLTNTLQSSMNTFKVQNISTQPFVINDSTDKANETNTSHLSHCDTDIDNIIFDTRNKVCSIKDGSIKIENIENTEEFAEKKITLLNKKEKYVASSTPIGKRTRCSIHPVLLSPIENIHDTINSKYKNSTIIAKGNAPIDISLERKDSIRSLNASECYKINITNKQKQQIQVLSPSQKLSMATDPAVKVETIPSNEDIHPAFSYKYNAQRDIKTECPHSLNISADTDRSRSLFGDTIYNCHHSIEDIGHNIGKECVTDEPENKLAKISNMAASLYLSTDLNLKENRRLLINNVHTDISSGYMTSPKIHTPVKTEKSGNLNDIACTRQKYKGQKKRNIEMNHMKIVGKNSKNETVNDSKDGSLNNSRDEFINTIDVQVLTKLQDPIRITKRMQYSEWHPSVSSISKSLNNRSALSNNEMFYCVATDDCSNISSIGNNLEHSNNAINSSLNCPKLLDNAIQQHSNDTNMQIRRSVFLKPGKCWTRSLSILSNVNPGSDLDKLCAGKGKKWRYSVRDILNMQKQGTSWSCLRKDQDNTNLSCGGLDTSIISSLDDNKCETVNFGRFSKRISVRVVPNDNANIKCDAKSVPFFEAFGIIVKNSPSQFKTLYKKKLSIDNVEYDDKHQIFRNHSATAKDVVLQRCSQKHYLPFSDCFPDSYLEYCRKIGEGVYGEVFLYEHADEKSVIKFIPIEGEELINGEPQKKFSEILSEIVIAEELHNLRLHSTHRTNAFVEVRSIKCIIGRYPEKLVKLWNIYDDDKTSDNDCPSIFGEHQLYIALELCHAGEDLEAFVFQTAEEAYALFLQTAVALAVAEKAFEFEHRDLHWGNILISRTEESYVYYNLDGKEIKFPSNNVKVSIIDYTLSRMLYQGCCIYNDLALDPALFTAHGEYQFEIYRLMRDKIQNNWQKFEPYTNVLWLHYTLDKMITAVRYKRKNLKIHKQAINKLKELKDTILNYDSVYNFVNDSNNVMQYMST